MYSLALYNGNNMHDLKQPLVLLGVLLCIVVIAMVWSMQNTQSPTERKVAAPDFVPGPPSPEVQKMLSESRGFEVLISYTDNGFEPKNVTLRRGESIRFTNNSSRELWVAAVGSSEHPPYPGMSDCGGSSFDTCKVLKPREFWEFTFEESGTWKFQNNLDKGQTGTVLVEVR